MSHSRPELLLLDLGGVLVEVDGVQAMLDWSREALSVDELWRRWLASPHVRRFESGRGDAESFARGIVEEFRLRVDAEAFLTGFRPWPRGLFEGAAELLVELSGRTRLACLSNTNAIHHGVLVQLEGLLDRFEACFMSHEIGQVKPDAGAFEHAVAALGLPAERILFLDDNALNVEAARGLGLRARQAVGLLELRAVLRDEGLLG